MIKALKDYRERAAELGGETERLVLDLVTEIEDLRSELAGQKLPALLGSTEVAERLGIDSRNMHHKKRTKFFPQPAVTVGTRPFWLERDIVEYKVKSDDWRKND
ncbi:hypothetical protein [Paenibacillus sp. R14(2021)]|uniref:hypothetical protein n=1 Tax=Paenibacillus sp. R14(2021) TaxID=2859228 RepID=UPI001C612B74|nr:hypothetical protein [Paenibacillus sp. R14(2021)]